MLNQNYLVVTAYKQFKKNIRCKVFFIAVGCKAEALKYLPNQFNVCTVEIF